jgi:hypothetical protein
VLQSSLSTRLLVFQYEAGSHTIGRLSSGSAFDSLPTQPHRAVHKRENWFRLADVFADHIDERKQISIHLTIFYFHVELIGRKKSCRSKKKEENKNQVLKKLGSVNKK